MSDLTLMYNQGNDGELIKYIAVHAKEIFNIVHVECKKITDKKTKTPLLISRNITIDDPENIFDFFRDIVDGEYSNEDIDREESNTPQEEFNPVKKMLDDFKNGIMDEEESMQPNIGAALTSKMMKRQPSVENNDQDRPKGKLSIAEMSDKQLDNLSIREQDNFYGDYEDF